MNRRFFGIFGIASLLCGASFGEVPIRAEDGVWSVTTESLPIVAYTPSGEIVPDELGIWSNGHSSLTTATVDGRSAFHAATDNSLMSFLIRHECQLEDAILSFDYLLPEDSRAVSLGVSVRVREWKGKLVGIRIVPTYGAWKHESFPLSRLMQGDRWRFGGAATASQLEVSVIGEKKDVQINFSNIRINSRPTAFSPLVRPQWLVGGGVMSRRFSVTGQPKKAWIMAFGRTNWTITVNGRIVGNGPKSEKVDGWKTRGMLNPAADQWSLDGFLRTGENHVEFTMEGDEHERGLIALGWISEGRRSVIVSDDAWKKGLMAVKAEALPDAEKPNLIDIYPLRPADAWRRPTTVPAYASFPSYAMTNALLAVHPENGKWGTVRGTSGRWLCQTPSGRPFFFYGMQTVSALWGNYAYGDWMRRAYDNQEHWASDTVDFVRQLGFNGLGVAATADSAFRAAAARGMVNLENIGCGERGPRLVNARGEQQWGLGDPFDPEFRKILRERLARWAPEMNARPDIFAICVGNEALIEGNILDRSSSGYVYSKACGEEFVRWLRERYASEVAALNVAWFGSVDSKYFTDFREVLVRKPNPLTEMPKVDDREYAAAMAHAGKQKTDAVSKQNRMKKDFDAFAVHVVKVYAELVLACMREYFPNKLIVSNRFMGGATREMYACWKGYDLIAVNTYPLDNRGDAVFNVRKVQLLRDAHEATGRPVLLTEWGVQGMDVNLQSPAAQLYTQIERGRGYLKVMRQVVETMPFVAGMVTFGFQHLADSEGQGWGVVNNQGQPYRDYVDGLVLSARWLDGYLKW